MVFVLVKHKEQICKEKEEDWKAKGKENKQKEVGTTKNIENN